MQLIYLDESGNTGNNLQETQQPVFVLTALLVPEQKWLALESELQAESTSFFRPLGRMILKSTPTRLSIHAVSSGNFPSNTVWTFASHGWPWRQSMNSRLSIGRLPKGSG
jgi:hypothetical protein